MKAVMTSQYRMYEIRESDMRSVGARLLSRCNCFFYVHLFVALSIVRNLFDCQIRILNVKMALKSIYGTFKRNSSAMYIINFCERNIQ